MLIKLGVGGLCMCRLFLGTPGRQAAAATCTPRQHHKPPCAASQASPFDRASDKLAWGGMSGPVHNAATQGKPPR